MDEINKKNSENITISTNNKESWQSKETTAKGSVESKNSLLSHSPSKDDLEKNNKNNSEDKNLLQNLKILITNSFITGNSPLCEYDIDIPEIKENEVLMTDGKIIDLMID